MKGEPRLNILLIYVSRTYPMRASQRDHLAAFGKYARDARVFYVNVAFGGVPAYLRRVRFDIIVFHWAFVGARVDRDWFVRRTGDLALLDSFSGIRIALPQDEFVSMDLLCEFIRRFDVRHVFSVAARDQWPKIYAGVDPDRTRFHQVLTGYLDPQVVQRASAFNRDGRRSIDIGYRTVSTAIWGRFNLVKAEIAELFLKAAATTALTVDIKVGQQHFFYGDDWLRFLARCRYTLGVEGGSSLLDWDGSLSDAIGAYLQRHPDADFDELEARCIGAGRDGEINVVAISPRHLEACLTRTVQILVEGEYNGILVPDVHYIRLARDYSNVGEVLARLDDEVERRRIADAAYAHVVASERFTYETFVREVIATSMEGAERDAAANDRDRWIAMLYRVSRLHDATRWIWVWLYSRLRNLRDAVKAHVPRR